MSLRLQHIFCTVLLLLSVACASTAPSSGSTELTNLRPDPGLMNWLQRQSFLYQAEDGSRALSGSHLGWTLNQQNSLLSLVQGTALWFEANPYHVIDEAPLLMLAKPSVLKSLKQAGFSGLYISPLTELAVSTQTYRPMSIQDSLSYSLKQLGTENDLTALRDKALQYGLWLGTDSLGSSIGFASDLALAVRAVKPWNSAFIMIEMPKYVWENLPASSEKSSDSFTVRPIDSTTRDYLISQALIPQRFARDGVAWLSPATWLVTDALPGADGKKRRWLIRTERGFKRTILHLDDPSGTAQRLLTGSILKNMGERQIPLLGINPESALGTTTEMRSSNLLNPGAAYIRDFHRRIKNYGGFSLVRTALPIEVLASLQSQGPDLMFDSVSSPATEIALLTGDTTALNQALATALQVGIVYNRLWRPLSNEQGLLLPLILGAGSADLRPLTWHDATYYDGQRLIATIPALAAMRLNISPQDTRKPKSLQAITDIHKNIFAFRAGLPGIVTVSAHDILGITHTPFSSPNTYTPFPAWSWQNTSKTITKYALPKGQALYASPDVQIHSPRSFLSYVKYISSVRSQLKIPEGELYKVNQISNPAIASYTVQTSVQRIMILMNFSNKTTSAILPAQQNYIDVFTGKTLLENTVKFTPFEIKWLVVIS